MQPHNVTSNDVQSRTDPCIHALLPLLNAQGSHLFLSLETRRTYTRDKWTELPFPADKWTELPLKQVSNKKSAQESACPAEFLV